MQPDQDPTADDLSALLHATERATGAGSFVWDGGRLRVSAGFRRLLQLSGEGPSGEELLLARVHPDDRPLLTDAWAAARGGEPLELVYRAVLPGGLRWLHAEASALPDGRLVGTLRDVTEQRAVARDLVRAQTLLGETQAAVGVGTYTLDLETATLEFSPELYRLAGLPPGAVDPARALAACHPEDYEHLYAWGVGALNGAEVPPAIARVVLPDGAVRTVELRMRRNTAFDGRYFLVGVVLDVSDRVELESQLRHAVKMEAVGTLAAGVAHDFNNYLTVLAVHLDLLRERGGDARPVSAMRHAVDQCAALTGQLLSFARKQPASVRVVDAGEAVSTVTELVRRILGPDVELRLLLPELPCRILVDPGQLEGALVNLVVNARDAMPEGGVLGLEVGPTELHAGDPLLVEGASPGRWIRVAVRDTGIGIPPAHLPRIFDPYFSTKGLGRGSGLGLASVYGTVRQHGGLIRVDSVEGKGTTIELFLPASDRPRSRTPEPVPRSDPPRRGRLLLVEDVEEVRELARDVLRHAGWDVSEAADGVEALEQLERRAFDLVLSDIRMPRMDGIQLLRELRRRGHGASVMLMTGYSDDVASAPGVPVIRKPFSTADLIARVDALFRAR